VKQQIEQVYQTDSHLVGILGWPVSADPKVIQAIEDLAPTKLPIISPTATADALDHHTYLYLVAPLNKVQAQAHIQLVKQAFSDAHPNQQARPIRVVILETQISTNTPSPYSESLARNFSDQSPPDKMKIVDTLKYVRSNRQEIQSAVDKAVEEEADIIYLPGYAEDANIALQELGKDDPKNSIKVVGGDALAHFINFPYTQYPSSSYQRLYYTSFSVPQINCNTNASNFYTHFYSTFGACPDNDALMGYDAAFTMFQALDQWERGNPQSVPGAGDLRTSLELNVISKHPVQVPDGSLSFDSGHRYENIIHSFEIVQCGSGGVAQLVDSGSQIPSTCGSSGSHGISQGT